MEFCIKKKRSKTSEIRYLLLQSLKTNKRASWYGK